MGNQLVVTRLQNALPAKKKYLKFVITQLQQASPSSQKRNTSHLSAAVPCHYPVAASPSSQKRNTSHLPAAVPCHYPVAASLSSQKKEYFASVSSCTVPLPSCIKPFQPK